MKTKKIVYWVLLGLFCLMMLGDGYAGISQQQTGRESFYQLGYPEYLLIIIGTAKVLGVIALLQPWFKIVREWAFAGFAFTFIGASLSWVCVHGPVLFVVMPLVMLGVLVAIYMLKTKKKERV